MNKIITKQEQDLLKQLNWNRKHPNKTREIQQMKIFLLILILLSVMFYANSEPNFFKSMIDVKYSWECETCGFKKKKKNRSCPICGRPR